MKSAIYKHVASLTLLAFLLMALAAGESDAKKRRKGKRKKSKPAPALAKTDDKSVSSLMGDFKWGMDKDTVLKVLNKQIDERYQVMIKDATGEIYKQDTLRGEREKEKKRIAKSYIEFEGKKTAWEVSIIQGEFDHKNAEAMLEVWEKDESTGVDQRRFFFFKDGQLWKMFVAFNAERFRGKGFADFRRMMEGRFGAGKDASTSVGVKMVHWISPSHYLRALDLTEFYGNFVLAVSQRSVENRIHKERAINNPKSNKRNNIVDSVMGKEGEKSGGNPNENIVDDIIGG